MFCPVYEMKIHTYYKNQQGGHVTFQGNVQVGSPYKYTDVVMGITLELLPRVDCQKQTNLSPSLSLKWFYGLNQDSKPKNKGIQNSESKRLTTLFNT